MSGAPPAATVPAVAHTQRRSVASRIYNFNVRAGMGVGIKNAVEARLPLSLQQNGTPVTAVVLN